MKKSLLALVVLGAFAGAASAQTNVTIYGVADVGVQRTKNVNADGSITGVTVPSTWGLTSGIQSGSRLGFKGTEDLGGGLAAIFTLENGFNIDNGTQGQGALFGRQAWVGLSSDTIGAIKLGRQYTPIFLAMDSVDPFSTGLAGDISNAFRAYGVRMNNTINYSTPNWNGLSGQVAYGFGELPGRTSSNRQIGASLGYQNGPINVVLAHHNQNTVAPVTLVDTGKSKTTFIGGTYDFRVVKAHAAFADNRDTPPLGATFRSRDWMLGVSAPIGAGTILASVIRDDDRSATNIDYNQYAIGYTHSLSKRTNLYTSLGRRDYKPAASADATIFNVGVRHLF